MPRLTLDLVNKSSKYIVSTTVGAVMLYYRSETIAWGVLGSVAVGAAAKVLKRVLKVPRPDTALEADPGMPSSHASCLSYLTLYPVLALHDHGAAVWMQALMLAVGSLFTALRVVQGNHTVAQVLAGIALGGSSAYLWRYHTVPDGYFADLFAANPTAGHAFWGAVYAVCLVFAIVVWKPKRLKPASPKQE